MAVTPQDDGLRSVASKRQQTARFRREQTNAGSYNLARNFRDG